MLKLNLVEGNGDVVMPKIEWIEPLKVEIEHFVDSILNGTLCLTDANNTKKVVNILEMGAYSDQ